MNVFLGILLINIIIYGSKKGKKFGGFFIRNLTRKVPIILNTKFDLKA